MTIRSHRTRYQYHYAPRTGEDSSGRQGVTRMRQNGRVSPGESDGSGQPPDESRDRPLGLTPDPIWDDWFKQPAIKPAAPAPSGNAAPSPGAGKPGVSPGRANRTSTGAGGGIVTPQMQKLLSATPGAPEGTTTGRDVFGEEKSYAPGAAPWLSGAAGPGGSGKGSAAPAATPAAPAGPQTRTTPTGGLETLMPSRNGGRWVASIANPPPVTKPGDEFTYTITQGRNPKDFVGKPATGKETPAELAAIDARTKAASAPAPSVTMTAQQMRDHHLANAQRRANEDAAITSTPATVTSPAEAQAIAAQFQNPFASPPGGDTASESGAGRFHGIATSHHASTARLVKTPPQSGAVNPAQAGAVNPAQTATGQPGPTAPATPAPAPKPLSAAATDTPDVSAQAAPWFQPDAIGAQAGIPGYDQPATAGSPRIADANGAPAAPFSFSTITAPNIAPGTRKIAPGAEDDDDPQSMPYTV